MRSIADRPIKTSGAARPLVVDLFFEASTRTRSPQTAEKWLCVFAELAAKELFRMESPLDTRGTCGLFRTYRQPARFPP